jgi:hypothetical protein
MKKSEIQEASQKAYKVAIKVYEEMASKQKQIAQEILAEFEKREQQKGAWA